MKHTETAGLLFDIEEVPGSIPGVPTIFSLGYDAVGSEFLALFPRAGGKAGGIY